MRSGWLKATTILARVLPPAPRQGILDRFVPLLAGVTVLAFAAGSSSVTRVTSIGHSLRWVALAALLVAAALWSSPRPRLTAGPAIGAASLAGIALLSTFWSVEPRLTFERAVSLGLLFCTGVLLAAGVRAHPERAAPLLLGVLGGAVAVGLLGLLLLAVDHSAAVQAASYEAPARFRGFGQDPNTVALLAGVVVPLAAWTVLAPRRRVAGAVALVLLAGTLVASGSRGGLASGAIGCALVVLLSVRRRARIVAGLAVIVAATAVGAVVQTLPKARALSPPVPSSTGTAKSSPKQRPRYADANAQYPLDADVGGPLPGGGQPALHRSFFSTSGRVSAWRGALHEVARRPVAGHGFGTEQDVFVDRYYYFVGGLPENSYIGLALQLGVAGLAALAALVVVLGRAGLRGLRGPLRAVGAACLGVLAAGLAAGLFQSYFYSVGNIAAAAFWIPAFLLGAVRPDE